MSELSLELLLLQVVLPALLEQGHTRQWLKNLVRGWCIAVAWLLDLRSYLLGDVPLEEPQAPEEPAEVPQEGAAAEPRLEEEPAAAGAEPQEEEAAADPAPPPAAAAAPQQPQGLGEAHQAMLQPGGPTGFQPYMRPKCFSAKVWLIASISCHQLMDSTSHWVLSSLQLVMLLAIMCATLFVSSFVSFILPGGYPLFNHLNASCSSSIHNLLLVYLGRCMMSIWMGETKVHELYTAACGLYTCWVTLRAGSVIYNWVPQGYTAILSRIQEWGSLVSALRLRPNLLLIGDLLTTPIPATLSIKLLHEAKPPAFTLGLVF